MENDWASDGEEEAGLGDISAIPEVKLPERAPKLVEPPQKPSPPVNAWATKPSDDVRNAVRRAQPQPRLPQTPNSRQQRRDSLHNSFAGHSERLERSNSRPASGSGNPRPTTLYVTNLPYDASENSIAGYFESQGVRVTNVRLTRHADTGNIKAAFVRIPPEQNRQHALSIDGRMFGSRNIHVKVDAADGNRRRDRGGSAGNLSYGSGFGGRERRENSSNGWSNGGWGDRPSASADAVERRTGDSRDDRRRESSQPSDPTIPTGPPPAGRKKLQLKPRTKPLPVLDVDKRAIYPLRAPASAPPVMAQMRDKPSNVGGNGVRRISNSSSEKPDQLDSTNKTESPNRSDKQEADKIGKEAWTAARETGAARQPSTNPSSNKKDDDSKRPVLLNAFAALEVNDLDA